MKKIIYISTSLFLFACGGTETSSSNDEGAVESPYAEGKAIYDKTCVSCHQGSGEGVPGTFPPLAKSDYLLEDIDRAIHQVLNGSDGEMIVNGETYNTIMPAQVLTDQEVVDVMNYVLNSWGNDGGEISLDDVSRVKQAN